MMQHSVPGSPGYGSWGGFAAPMPFSPTALQIAAASGALGSNPGTPSAGGRAFLAGSPGPLSPGQMMFARVRDSCASVAAHVPALLPCACTAPPN